MTIDDIQLFDAFKEKKKMLVIIRKGLSTGMKSLFTLLFLPGYFISIASFGKPEKIYVFYL